MTAQLTVLIADNDKPYLMSLLDRLADEDYRIVTAAGSRRVKCWGRRR